MANAKRRLWSVRRDDIEQTRVNARTEREAIRGARAECSWLKPTDNLVAVRLNIKPQVR